MGQSFSIGISDVVKLLGLEADPKTKPGSPSYNVKCPFCDTSDDKRYHMNINEAKDAYRCVRCSGDEKKLGVLELYSRVRFGCSAAQKGPGNVYKALAEELNLDTHTIGKTKNMKKEPAYKIIRPAADEKLHAAYSALLNLPYMGLSGEHRQNLLKRGLGIISIALNGYGSIVFERFTHHPYYETAQKIYREKKEFISKNPKLEKQKKLSVIAGLIIAHDLEREKTDMLHVPGFFLLDNVWCMKADEGMLIPTRNMKGQIVGIQTRTDVVYKEGLRYITLSSKDLDEGPNTDISRIHFPLENSEMDTTVMVGLTEGPLKADITAALYGKPVYIFAIQGVNNTRELPEIISNLKNTHIVWNMLDMDRFVNVHVQKAAKAIESKFAEKNIEFSSLVWDTDYLNSFRRNLKRTCEKTGIKMPELTSGKEDEWIRQIFNAFAAKHLNLETSYSLYTGKSFCWNPESKGIDDYLKMKGKYENGNNISCGL